MAIKPERSASNTFTIKSDEDGTKFTGTFGDGPAIVTEGYAGWQIVQRPHEVGLTEWVGRNPMAIEIPFIIDNYLDRFETSPGVRCEEQVQNLETLCGIGTHHQPPICVVDGKGMIPHDATIYGATRWVIENLAWDKGMEVRSGTSGRRLRCGGTITIRQFPSPSPILRQIGPNAKAKKPRIIRVKKGDTLAKLAAHFYKDAGKWKVIADANRMRDRRSLSVGRYIKVPYL